MNRLLGLLLTYLAKESACVTSFTYLMPSYRCAFVLQSTGLRLPRNMLSYKRCRYVRWPSTSASKYMTKAFSKTGTWKERKSKREHVVSRDTHSLNIVWLWHSPVPCSHARDSYKEKIRNVDELRERIVESRDHLDQSIVDFAISQWHARLQACVKDKSGHIEHIFWLLCEVFIE